MFVLVVGSGIEYRPSGDVVWITRVPKGDVEIKLPLPAEAVGPYASWVQVSAAIELVYGGARIRYTIHVYF
jgi:hypothetical protein